MKNQNRLENYIHIIGAVQNYSILMANEPRTKDLIHFKNDEKFDLILIELYHFDTYFALSARFNAPIIGISFQTLNPIYNWILKNPWSFANVPHLYSPFSDRMNFFQRLINAAFGCFTIIFYNLISLPSYQRQIESLAKSANVTLPSIENVTENLSLILVESHFSAGYVRPTLPNVIDVAGIHIAAKKKLPQVCNIIKFCSYE